MSNAAIYISWGQAFAGRETKSLEVFSQMIELYAGLKSNGRIAEFRTYYATNGALEQFSAFVLVEGTVAQCREVVDSEDFQMLLLKGTHVVSNMHVVHLGAGDDVLKVVGRAIEARKQLDIT